MKIWIEDGDRFVAPTYVNEGDEVLAPYKGTTAIRCEVTAAAGYHARVENKKHEFCKWFHIDYLRIEKKE